MTETETHDSIGLRKLRGELDFDEFTAAVRKGGKLHLSKKELSALYKAREEELLAVVGCEEAEGELVLGGHLLCLGVLRPLCCPLHCP